MDRIEFKRAEADDIPDILRIIKKSFTDYADTIHTTNIAALHETADDVKRDIETKHVYVCLVDGEIVGSVRFEVLSDGIAYLSRLAVNPEIQDLGIGGLLLEKVKRECIKLDVRAITLYTASKMRTTVAFYLKNGYYVHDITRDHEYVRAFLVNELVPMDELYDYFSVVGNR